MIMLSGCSTKTEELRRAFEEKREMVSSHVVGTYGQLTAESDEALFNDDLIDILSAVKLGDRQTSEFYKINNESGAFEVYAIQPDDIIVSSVQKGIDYRINTAKDRKQIIDNAMAITFVNGKMFTSGTSSINSQSLVDLERLVKALKKRNYYLHVRAFDGFNPFNYQRSKNSVKITKDQITALKNIIVQMSPAVAKRTTYEAMGNSEALVLASANMLTNKKSKQKFAFIKNFVPVNANASVRVEFIISANKFSAIVEDFCSDESIRSYQCNKLK